MSWLGERLSTLTGHLQSLTKEVLSENKDVKEGSYVELKDPWRNVEDSRASCGVQESEDGRAAVEAATMAAAVAAAAAGGRLPGEHRGQGEISKEAMDEKEVAQKKYSHSVDDGINSQGENKSPHAGCELLEKEHEGVAGQLLDMRSGLVEKSSLESQPKESEEIQETESKELKGVEAHTPLLPLTEAATQTELIMLQEVDLQEERMLKYSQELCEKMKKMFNFLVSYEGERSDPLLFMKAVVKSYNELKWKKDSLEKKINVLMKQYVDAKETIAFLEEECLTLRENVEQLAEQLTGIGKNGKQALPTIHENSEESEVMEENITAMLEGEVDMLHRTRTDMGAGTSKMKERCQKMQSQVWTQEKTDTNIINLKALGVELQETGAVNDLVEQTLEVTENELTVKESNVAYQEKEVRRCSIEVNKEHHVSMDEEPQHRHEGINETFCVCQRECGHKTERDLEQRLEKRENMNKEGCVCGVANVLPRECIGCTSDTVELEGKNKEIETRKEKVEHFEKNEQFGVRGVFHEENSGLSTSDGLYQQKIEVLQRKENVSENELESNDAVKVSVAGVDDAAAKELQENKLETLRLLEERTREIDMLNSKIKHLNTVVEENLTTISQLEKANVELVNLSSKNEEKFVLMKETIANLSDMVRKKEEELSEAREQGKREMAAVQEAAAQAMCERDQLVQTVQVKHQESLQYHAEVHRLTAVLAEEMRKYEDMVMQYSSAVQKLKETKTVAEMSEKIQQFQSLLAERDGALKECSKQLHVKELELQTCHIELEALRNEINSVVLRGRPDGDVDPEEQVDAHDTKEAALQREVERLRLHLIETEQMHTREMLQLEESVKELQNKLLHAEEHMKTSSTLYKSASIRANQQVETLQEQARLIAQQRDEVQEKLSAAEDQVAKHRAALCNLQAVLERFQQDKEREILAATAVVQLQLRESERKHSDLLAEIASLKLQLNEAKEGLGAAARLGEQLERKTTLIAELKKEVADLQEKLKKAESDAESATHVIEGKIDKSLAKNVVLGYFLAPSNSKQQVLHIVASVLDFSEQERKQVLQKLGYPGSETTSSSWFKNFLHHSEADDDSKQSLSEAFVRFLEKESIPHPKLRMLPGSEPQTSTSVSGVSSSSSHSRSPLLLPDVQLPAFVQVCRSSSTVLKDILKES